MTFEQWRQDLQLAWRGLLFGVHHLDAVSMLAAVLLVVGASVLVSYLPASRAARVDPLTLLRAG